ncbi:unnamed protein product [Orchesella dallaii]|uniref:EamA domain-containing protein n=1 Tax=Orchesella dallaii TaxID=48710 RepID=A0ABP1QX17_9HEXA
MAFQNTVPASVFTNTDVKQEGPFSLFIITNEFREKSQVGITVVVDHSLPVHPISEEDSDYDSDEEDGESGSQVEIVEVGKKSLEECSETRSKRSVWRKYRGILLALASSLIFTVSAILVKKLDTFDPFNTAFYKFQGALIPAIPLLLQKRFCSKKGSAVTERVWPLTERQKLKAFGLVLLRSFLSCNALLLHYFSMKYLPMGDALTIASASPLFVGILAKVFLGEKCGYSTVIASILSLLGVAAISKPPVLTGSASFNGDILIGSGLAFGCTLVTAVSYIVLRHIRKVHYSVTTLTYGGWGSLETLIVVLLIPGLKIPSGSTEWIIVIALAVLTLVGQLAIILAMKSEQAGPVALVRTADTLFGFMLEIAIFRKFPDIWSIIGATVIVLSVAFIALRKWVRSLPKGHSVRRKLWFVSM